MSNFSDKQKLNIKEFFTELVPLVDKVNEKNDGDPYPFMLLYIALAKDGNNDPTTVIKVSRNVNMDIRAEGPAGAVASLMLHDIAQTLADDSVQSVKEVLEAHGETDVDVDVVRSTACKILLETTSALASMLAGRVSAVSKDAAEFSKTAVGTVQ